MPLGFGTSNYKFYDTSEIKYYYKPFSKDRNIESNILFESEIVLDKNIIIHYR